MGLKHTKEVRESLPKQVQVNGTSKPTAKCNCSPCNCNPCKCPEKSIATNGSEDVKTICGKPEDGKQSDNSQCQDVTEVNADEAQDPSTPPQEEKSDQPTPDAEVKPVEEELATSPVIEVNNTESTNTTQADEQAGTQVVVGSNEQQ